MSLRNPVQDIEQAGIHGMDSTSPVQSVQEGYVVSAKNARPGLRGGWIKRGGYSEQLTNDWSTLDVTGGFEYKVSGSRVKILFGTDGSGTGGIIGQDVSGTVSSIVTSLSGTARPSFVQFGSLLFFFNGSDAPVVYNGSASRQMGITAPTNVPTESSQGTSGSLTQASSYVYAYTYYNSVTGAESSPSPLLTVTLTSSNDDVTVGVTAGSSSTADQIRLYRTVANGNTLFLEQSAAISTTSFNSTAADSALGEPMELDNTRVTVWNGAPSFPQVVQDRIFLRTGANEVRFSKISRRGSQPESFEAKSFVPCVGSFGESDGIVGIAKAGDLPIILKERSIGACYNTGIRNLTSAVDQEAFVYQEISADVEAVGHFAASEVYGECVLLAKDNIYATRGAKGDLRPVADDIAADIIALGLSSTQASKVSSLNDTEEKLLYFAVFASSSDSDPTILLCGDYRRYPEFRWSLWTPGTNSSTHPGIRAASLFAFTNSTSGRPEAMFGNTDGNGQYYKLNDGTNDNGKGIYWEIITRPYFGGRPLEEKLFKDATFYVQGDGTDYNVEIHAIYDLSGEAVEEQTFTLSAGGAEWDVAEWDVDVWGSNQVLPRTYNAHRKANYQQLVFRQTDADAPVTLFGWGTTASLFRPR